MQLPTGIDNGSVKLELQKQTTRHDTLFLHGIDVRADPHDGKIMTSMEPENFAYDDTTSVESNNNEAAAMEMFPNRQASNVGSSASVQSFQEQDMIHLTPAERRRVRNREAMRRARSRDKVTALDVRQPVLKSKVRGY